MMFAAPSPAFAEIPDWYCHLAMRREVTFLETLLMVFHWLFGIAILPVHRGFTWLWQQLFHTIQRDNPRIFEMYLAFAELRIALFIWGFVGTDIAQKSMLELLERRAPLGLWAAGATLLCVIQVAATLSGRWHVRAYALTCSFVGWSLFNGALERWGFGLINNLTDPIWIWCLISVACLMWQHSHGGGTGGTHHHGAPSHH